VGGGDRVQHAFATAGTYAVALTVTDNAGGAATAGKSVTVEPPNQAPTAAFTFACTDLRCNFDASVSSDADGIIAAYEWQFGDGETAAGAIASHSFAVEGTYTVALQVRDDDGDADDASQQVTVTAPVVDPPPDDPPPDDPPPDDDPLNTTIYPGEDIQAAVDANPAGTEFLIKAGVHRLQSVRPKSGNTFTGEPGAIMSGAKVLTEFQRDGDLWVATGQTQENPNRTGYCWDGTGNGGVMFPAAPRCNYPEDMFIDGQPLFHVASRGDVGPGSWFFDYPSDRIYFYDDPNGHLVETSVSESAFNGVHGASGVTIQGLIIENYAAPAQIGAIYFPNGNDWYVVDNEVRYNHGVGIDMATNSGARVIGNYIHHNGQLGFGAFKPVDLLLEGNELAFNGRAGRGQ
jgi:PKD repeat protein